MEKKAIILNEIGSIEYKELKDEYIYKPTAQEEDEHGTKVYALQNGAVGNNDIEVEAVLGSICTHEVSLYNTYTSLAEEYACGEMFKTTMQLGYGFLYHAQKDKNLFKEKPYDFLHRVYTPLQRAF